MSSGRFRKYFSHVFLCFLCVSVGKAQYNSEFLKYADYGKHISVYGDVEFNSNAINNNFAEKFYLGGFIDSATKQNVAGKMKDINYMGGGFCSGVNVFFGKDSSAISWLIGVKDQAFANAAFSRDLFNTGFFGNKMYEGKKAYFNNSSINFMRFQEIKLGFVWKDADSIGKMGAALSILNGQKLFQFQSIDTNYLYTAPDATQLSLNANFSMNVSDPSNNNRVAMNGLGIAADFYVETPYKSKLGPSKILITLNNLGFINWNKKTESYRVDSLFQFSGYYIHNINDLKDSSIQAINRDSILNTISHVSKTNLNTSLPMNLMVIHQIDFSNSFSLKTGLRNIFAANYKPFVFIDSRFRLSGNFSTGILLAYGGYGKFTSGLYVECNMKKKWYLKVGSNAVQGFFQRNQSLGQSAYLTLSRKFK